MSGHLFGRWWSLPVVHSPTPLPSLLPSPSLLPHARINSSLSLLLSPPLLSLVLCLFLPNPSRPSSSFPTSPSLFLFPHFFLILPARLVPQSPSSPTSPLLPHPPSSSLSLFLFFSISPPPLFKSPVCFGAFFNLHFAFFPDHHSLTVFLFFFFSSFRLFYVLRSSIILLP